MLSITHLLLYTVGYMASSDILTGLNAQQLQAVSHIDGPMLVVAGAGTGKTQVITRRIARLIADDAAKPSQILALTFTERAAREMQERLYDLIGWQSFQVAVMTFHAFGAELLARYGSHIGRSTRGGLLNDNQKSLLLSQHFSSISLEYYKPGQAMMEFIQDVVAYIGLLQNAGITSETYSKYTSMLDADQPQLHPFDRAEQRDLAKIYSLYEHIKTKTGTFDYHDQMELPLKILSAKPNLVTRLRNEYRHVLVDEYQDTNATQDLLLRQLVGEQGNIFAVGDDDQAIYGFRGADIYNILDFTNHFRLNQAVALVQNYRSGQSILDIAYRLICYNNPERLEAKLGIDKQLKSQNQAATVMYNMYSTVTDEHQGVVDDIKQRLDRGELPQSMAVLATKHTTLAAVAKLLRVRGVSYNLAESVSIFEQPELLTLWYLLQWISGDADEVAISHVLIGKYLNWPADQYEQVASLARDQSLGLEEALEQIDTDWSKKIRSQLRQWRQWSSELPISQLVYRLVFETTTADTWRQQSHESPRMVRVFEDLQRWLEHMQDFETVSDDGSLRRYLAFYATPPKLEATEPVGDADGVSLLTVHASKGLEFETVFLIDCSHSSWTGKSVRGWEIPPTLINKRALAPEHEYRRLMYVAITRAKQNLVVSFATKTRNGSRKMPTPMLAEAFGDQQPTQLASDVQSDKVSQLMTKLQRFYPLQASATPQRLPYERADGWLELSVTALAQYDYCPFEFYLQEGLRLVQPIGPQLQFGNLLHKVFELYYRAKQAGESATTQNWHQFIDEQWSDRGYEQANLAEADRLLAHQTFDAYVKRETSTSRRPMGFEVPVRFEMPEAKLRMRGKIDAIFQVDDGLSLRDYKTGRSVTTADKLAMKAKNNFQLRTYALIAARTGMGEVVEIVLDHVVVGVEGIANLSPKIMANHHDKLLKMAKNIRDRQFAPASEGGHVCQAVRYYGTGERDELAEELMRELVDADESS